MYVGTRHDAMPHAPIVPSYIIICVAARLMGIFGGSGTVTTLAGRGLFGFILGIKG